MLSFNSTLESLLMFELSNSHWTVGGGIPYAIHAIRTVLLISAVIFSVNSKISGSTVRQKHSKYCDTNSKHYFSYTIYLHKTTGYVPHISLQGSVFQHNVQRYQYFRICVIGIIAHFKINHSLTNHCNKG